MTFDKFADNIYKCVVDSGKFDWGKVSGKFPSLTEPEEAYHGLKFYETFGDMTFTLYSHAVGLRDLGPTMAPQNGKKKFDI